MAAKIAAGEVVERPFVGGQGTGGELPGCGGFSRSPWRLKGGGIQLIRVSDNGCGIPTPEVELGLSAATPPARCPRASDLDSIDTLGFRGEALPSIASVARVSRVHAPPETRSPGYEKSAWRGGTWSTKSGSKGLLRRARRWRFTGLFEDLPARRKFLKSPSAETGTHR